MAKEWEIVVIGGGPAGLSAAAAAAESGAQVTVLDAYPIPGGQYYRQPPEYLNSQPTLHQRQGQELWRQVRQAGVMILNSALVWYADSSKRIIVHTPEGCFDVQAKALILATGAFDRPVAFPGWTLPGVLMTGGAQTMLYQHVLPGKRVLLAGTGPLQLVVAKKLLDAGAQVIGVLEGNRMLPRAVKHLPAMWGQRERMEEGLSSYTTLLRHGVPYRQGWGILEAHGTHQVEGATIARLDRAWRPIPNTQMQVSCDTICTGYGFIPFNSLSRQMGAQQIWNDRAGGIIPKRDENLQTSLAGIYAAGDCAGIGGVRMSLIEGRIAGYSAAESLGHQPPAEAMQKARFQQRHERAFQRLLVDLFTHGSGVYEIATDDTLICRCEGVTKKMLVQAVASGVKSIIELKSFTRCGMGECQGRICEDGVLHLVEQLSHQPVDANNGFHLRPPVLPLSLEMISQTPLD